MYHILVDRTAIITIGARTTRHNFKNHSASEVASGGDALVDKDGQSIRKRYDNLDFRIWLDSCQIYLFITNINKIFMNCANS